MKIAIDRQIDTKVPGLAIAAVDADGWPARDAGFAKRRFAAR